MIIAGLDEVGRGAVAGPVVAGACVLTEPVFARRHSFTAWSVTERKKKDEPLIADSKLLSPEQREKAFIWLTDNAAIGIGIVEVSWVEERGILSATNQAMLLALGDLQKKIGPTMLKIDGRDHFTFPLPHESIIGGDRLVPEIAAASIAAKVTRDALMRRYGQEYPLYGFAQHKGYGSGEHMAAIEKHGPCPIHRRSFLRRILETQTLSLTFETT